MNVVESSRCGAAPRGFVKSEESLPAQAGRASGRIVQQVGFGREAQQDRHRNAARIFAARWRRRGIAMRHFPALDVSNFVEGIIEFILEDQF